MVAMDEARTRYEAPPRPRTAEGALRKVGIELELGYLSLEETARIAASALGGHAVIESPAEAAVEDTPLGTFKIELDSKPIRERRYFELLAPLGITAESPLGESIEGTVVRAAREVVPVELVSPPIAWDQLESLDPLWVALREAGAEDTRSSILHAFGLHLNPEIPAVDAPTILAYLRSYLLLEDLLVELEEVDASRRVAPYIHPFPEAYRRLVLAPTYAPELDALIADYVTSNPTRNRPLDLLPLFAFAKRKDFGDEVESHDLVKPRPAFHYRLPNSEIVAPGWSPAIAWNAWVKVERLADAPELMRELASAYLATPDAPLRMQRRGWLDTVRAYLPALGGSPPAS
jgi:hypothetical protein